MVPKETAVEIADLRRTYAAGGLSEADLEPDPIAMFGRWFEDARSAGLREPNAMVLATADPEPSARTVLLKGLDGEGFRFFTNLASAKARAIETQPMVSLLFPWHDLERQVRVAGRAAQIPRSQVSEYFASRPRESQLGAWASPQSEVVADREWLEEHYAEVESRFAGTDDIPPPDHWGGYLVAPTRVEFWQGRPGRMHDRLVYSLASPGSLDGSAWRVERLAP